MWRIHGLEIKIKSVLAHFLCGPRKLNNFHCLLLCYIFVTVIVIICIIIIITFMGGAQTVGVIQYVEERVDRSNSLDQETPHLHQGTSLKGYLCRTKRWLCTGILRIHSCWSLHQVLKGPSYDTNYQISISISFFPIMHYPDWEKFLAVLKGQNGAYTGKN